MGSVSLLGSTPADPDQEIPVGGDTVDVEVLFGGEGATLSGGFTYYPLLTLSSVSPTSGPTSGGTVVTLSGTNFQSGATVLFGSDPATVVTFNSATSLSATTPNENAGAVDVTVTNPDGQSAVLSGGFTYNGFLPAPTLSSVTPTSGPTVGGTVVTLNGTNFQSGATVQFASGLYSAQASAVTVNSYENISATTPPAPFNSGQYDVTVTNPDGQSAVLANGFLYTSGYAAH